MRVRVRLFATYREIVGAGEVPWSLPDGATLGSLVAEMLRRYPRLAGHRDTMLLAVNHELARPEASLAEGDEVALLPPVSGGAA